MSSSGRYNGGGGGRDRRDSRDYRDSRDSHRSSDSRVDDRRGDHRNRGDDRRDDRSSRDTHHHQDRYTTPVEPRRGQSGSRSDPRDSPQVHRDAPRRPHSQANSPTLGGDRDTTTPPRAMPSSRGRGGGAPRGERRPGKAFAPPPDAFIPQVVDSNQHPFSGRVPRPPVPANREGRQIKVFTNHFAIEPLKGSFPPTIYHYHVSFPEDFPKTYARKLWDEWQAELGIKAVFDGAANAFSTVEIPGELTKQVSARGHDLTIVTRVVNTIHTEDLVNFIQGSGPITNNVNMAIHAFDIVLRQRPSEKYTQVLRSFVDVNTKSNFDIGQGLVLKPGLFLSVNALAGQITLNVDSVVQPYFKALNVDQFADELMRDGPLDRGSSKLSKALHKMTITPTHRKPRGDRPIRSEYVIGLGEPARQAMFQLGEASDPISVEQYFDQQYQIRLRRADLPVLKLKSKTLTQNWLPMECAKIVPDAYRGALSPRQTAEVIKHTGVKPQIRVERIKSFMSDIGFDRDPNIESFGLRMSTRSLLEIPGRILPPPTVLQGGRDPRTPEPVRVNEGKWRVDKCIIGSTLASLGVMCLADRMRPDDVGRAVDGFLRQAKIMGMTIGASGGVPVDARSVPVVMCPRDLVQGMRELVDKVRHQYRLLPEVKPSILIVILPQVSIPEYGRIKAIGDVEVGVLTQCLVAQKLQKANAQYWANVVLKVNIKLNPFSRNFTISGCPLFQKPTMLVAATVTHPPVGSSDSSMASMVASRVPDQPEGWAAQVQQQKSGVSEILNIEKMFARLLRKYVDKNGNSLPHQVVMYREGVSEGQFSAVVDTEVSRILAVIRRASDDIAKKSGTVVTCNLTFIIVTKGHHTRFFPVDNRTQDQSGNIVPGLFVDSHITHPSGWDWYLQSQATLKGTMRPTRYSVLHDANAFEGDLLPLSTYHLCYAYSRCSRSISDPSPVRYAQLVAKRARHHVVYGGGDGTLSSFGSASHGSANELGMLESKPVPVNPALGEGTTMYYM